MTSRQTILPYQEEYEPFIQNVTEKANSLFNYQSPRTAAEFYIAVRKLVVPIGYLGRGFFRGIKTFNVEVQGDLESEIIRLEAMPLRKYAASYTRFSFNQEDSKDPLEIHKAIAYVEPLFKGLSLLANVALNKGLILVPTEVNVDGQSKRFDFTSRSTIHTTLKQS